MLFLLNADQTGLGRRRGKPLQESLIKLVEACGDASHNMDRWLSKLENSKWLSHVQTALSTAGLLAECVERYEPAPVHCTHIQVLFCAECPFKSICMNVQLL